MISDEESVKNLEQKDFARILLISDSHGSKSVVSLIAGKFGRSCDALCFCGDGMEDILSIVEDFSMTPGLDAKIPKVLAFVQGNGDNANYTLVTDARIPISVPPQIEISAAGKKILMTHGHRYNVYTGTKELVAEAERIEADAVFYGHTHIANAQVKTNIRTKKKIAILNPGSCSVPRGGLPHTFAIVEIEKKSEKISYEYFEIKWGSNGDVEFIPFAPPAKEINLFW